MKNVKTVALVIILVLSAFSLAPPVEVLGSEIISEVSEATGQTFVIREGQSMALSPGTPLYLNDTLTTGSPGKAKIQCRDGSILYLGPGSALDILGPGYTGLRKGSLKVRNRGVYRVQPGDADEIRAATPMSEFIVIVGDGVEVMSLRNRVTMGTIRVSPQVSATKRPGEWASFKSISLVDTEQLFAGLSDSFPKPPEEANPAVPERTAEIVRTAEPAPAPSMVPVTQHAYSAPPPPQQVEAPVPKSSEPPAETYRREFIDAPEDSGIGQAAIHNPPTLYSRETMESDTPRYRNTTSSSSMKDVGGLVGWLYGGEIQPPNTASESSIVTSRGGSSRHSSRSLPNQGTWPPSMAGPEEIGGLIGWLVEEEVALAGGSPEETRQSSQEIGGLVGWWVGNKYQTSRLDTETRDSALPESETLIGGLPE